MKNYKPTKAEKAARVNEVYKALLTGTSRGEIVQYFSNKFDVVDRTIDDYIAEAKEKILQQLENTREDEFATALSRLDMLLAHTLKTLDYRTALSVQKERNALLGLYAPRETKNQHEINAKIAWDDIFDLAQFDTEDGFGDVSDDTD